MLVALGVVCVGCAPPSDDSDMAILRFESRQPERMAAFFLGAYGTPLEVASALSSEGPLALRLDSLSLFAPKLASAARLRVENGVLTREGFASAIAETYRASADVPATRDQLWDLVGERPESGSIDWLTYEVSGSMTRFRRRIHLRRKAVQEALGQFARGGELSYSNGTVVVGEHLDGGVVRETTAMIRREDGYWSFVAFDESGAPMDSIDGTPDRLGVPGDCFGCHYGTRQFEPERSFPGQARPGPAGPRSVHVPDSFRDAAVVQVLQEHARRSDGLLGLPATLYVAGLKRGEPADSLDRAILEAFR